MCDRCGTSEFNENGNTFTCICNYRFLQMIRTSKIMLKYTPTMEELELLYAKLEDMQCPHCKKTMGWIGRSPETITLQHYADGTIDFLCYSCNSRHGKYKDDSFMAIPLDSRKCNICGKVKLLTEFNQRNIKGNFGGRAHACRECANNQSKMYKSLNRERYRQNQRSKNATA